MDRNKFLGVVNNVLGENTASYFGKIFDIFDYMEMAEREIARVKAEQTDPEAAQRAWESFTYLQPGFLMGQPKLYQAHAGEIAERAAQGKSLVPATYAEIMMVLMEASLAAPLNSDGYALYSHIFITLFPEDAKRIGIEPYPEPWKGFYGAEIETLQRRMRQEWRKGAKPQRRAKVERQPGKVKQVVLLEVPAERKPQQRPEAEKQRARVVGRKYTQLTFGKPT